MITMQEIQRCHKVNFDKAKMIKRVLTRAQFAKQELSADVVRLPMTSTEFQFKMAEVDRHASVLIEKIKAGEIVEIGINGLVATIESNRGLDGKGPQSPAIKG